MGKTKHTKEKKFDRNVEISAPILDPEIIKAIHTPPDGKRLDIKHAGFKALLSDLNSQDSTDELVPLNADHKPSYIGISCAVSGYSNYSSYTRKVASDASSALHPQAATKIINRAISPSIRKAEPQINHITVDKNNFSSVDEERRELTEKLIASAGERKRSPSPCVPPTEEDRHHGAYVKARYFPMPDPEKVTHKHIPLLGVDDDIDPEEAIEEENKENKVEKRIASLYGDKTLEDWRESMTHKTKKEIISEHDNDKIQQASKNPRDLVSLKPPTPRASEDVIEEPYVGVDTKGKKVFSNMDQQFLHRLATDENPPVPSQSPIMHRKADKELTATSSNIVTDDRLSPLSGRPQSASKNEIIDHQEHDNQLPGSPSQAMQIDSPLLHSSSPVAVTLVPDDINQFGLDHSDGMMSSDLDLNQSSDIIDGSMGIPISQATEEHIEYEIRAQSPFNNESSPVKRATEQEKFSEGDDNEGERSIEEVIRDPSSAKSETYELNKQENLVSFSPEPSVEQLVSDEPLLQSQLTSSIHEDEASNRSEQLNDCNRDGCYYLNLLKREKSFMLDQITRAEKELPQNDDEEVGSDRQGRLRSAIGKANLLINKKFKQFEELCVANIKKDANDQFATLNDDLAGFWDMISIQIADVNRSFEALWLQDVEKLQSAGHKEIPPVAKLPNTKDLKAPLKPKLCVLKDQERRERLQEHINQMKLTQAAAAKLEAENLSKNTITADITALNNNESGDESPTKQPLETSGSKQVSPQSASSESVDTMEPMSSLIKQVDIPESGLSSVCEKDATKLADQHEANLLDLSE